MTRKNSDGWWTILTFGSDPCPARGPFRSLADARAAVRRFRQREGALAGTWLAASSARIVGPFQTRAAAKRADVSDYGCAGVRSYPCDSVVPPEEET